MTWLALVIDTETSGLLDNGTLPLQKQPEIIEWFSTLVDFDTGEIKSEIDTLIKPARPVSAEITGITGITNEMLADAPPFSVVADQIREAIEGAPRVIAHNLSFDREITDLCFRRLDWTIKWPRLICTVEQTLHLKGFRQNLQGLHEHLFGERFAEAHRARNDVQALVRCCVELRKLGEL